MHLRACLPSLERPTGGVLNMDDSSNLRNLVAERVAFMRKVRWLTATSAVLLCSPLFFPLHAQDPELGRLNFNLGGGLSVPLNPMARYTGVNGNGTTGVGVNFDKHNSVEGDFLWVGLLPTAHSLGRFSRLTPASTSSH